MTEQEAIKNINTYIYSELESIPKQLLESLKLACFTLKEVEQYRAIGTPEECRKAMILMKKNAARKFPIIDGTHIPWEVIEIHEHQALINHGQTLQRLAERGGLSWGEASAVLDDRRFDKRDWDMKTSRKYVLKEVENFYKRKEK